MAGVKTLKKLSSENPETNKIQDNTQAALDPVLKSPLLNGTLLQNIKLQVSKNNDVDHKLNRNLRGWILVRQRAEATIWDLQDSNNLSKKTLRLRTTADVTVDIWVF